MVPAPQRETTGPLQGGMNMLVLSRKAGERILIGDEIAIVVVRIGPNTVKLGVEAPKTVSIVREEIADPTGVVK